jgi:hypothetical protein
MKLGEDGAIAPGSAPDIKVVSDTPQERTYTAAEVEAKLRGLVSQNSAAQAKLDEIAKANEAAEQKRLAEQGEFKGLAEIANGKLTEQTEANAKLMAELNTLKAAETDRLTALQSVLDERVKVLPDQFKALVPSGLPPDALAAHLSNLETLAAKSGQSGILSGVAGKGPQAKTPSEENDARLASIGNMMLGKK